MSETNHGDGQAQEPGTTPGDEGASPEASAAERARLEALFQKWDSDRPDVMQVPAPLEEAPEPITARWHVDLFHLWITLTCVVLILGAWFMFMTRMEVAYWMQRDAPPIEAGDVGAKWARGERELGLPSNAWVHIEGMFATLESEGESLAKDSRGKITNFWLDPLYSIVVRTPQPFPEKPERSFASLEVDAAFVELLEKRVAFPGDLTVRVAGTGRLLRADEAPRWHKDPLLYYARLTRKDPHDLWLFIDGDDPADYAGFAAVWGVSVTVMLGALALLLRAWLRRRREGEMSP